MMKVSEKNKEDIIPTVIALAQTECILKMEFIDSGMSLAIIIVMPCQLQDICFGNLKVILRFLLEIAG